jgi:hypothetical protein
MGAGGARILWWRWWVCFDCRRGQAQIISAAASSSALALALAWWPSTTTTTELRPDNQKGEETAAS